MKKGFTLIELLISIAVVSVLAGMYLINYRSIDGGFALERSAYQLAQDIRKVQGMAMSSKELPETPEGFFGSYGIFLKEEEGSYILFADKNEDNSYEWGEGLEAEAGNLENGVTITALSPVSAQGQLSIVFSPPDPEVSFDAGAGNTASIVLSLDNRTAEIIVNKSGMVSILKQ